MEQLQNLDALLRVQLNAVNHRSPESEEALMVFEAQYGCRIPATLRWLLRHHGACHLLDPALYSLNELHTAHPLFLQSWREYRDEYDLPERRLFPPGVMGDGSTAAQDLADGSIHLLLHN